MRPLRKTEGVHSMTTVICDHAEGCTRDAKCPHLVPHEVHKSRCCEGWCPRQPYLEVRCVLKGKP